MILDYHEKEKVLKRACIGDQGIALMMILWVLILLDIIVLQFAASMRTEVEITKNLKDTIEAYYIARAGLELAKYELKYVASRTKIQARNKYDKVDFRPDRTDRDVNQLWEREESFGAGRYKIEYHAKEEKYDLNTLATSKQKKLDEILIACGVEPESAMLSMISRSIIDWADADETLAGPDIGAEDDWYSDNPHPDGIKYECKDSLFYEVEELALIRGLRPESGDSEEERAEKENILECLYNKVNADPFRYPSTKDDLNKNFLDCNSLIEEYGEESGTQMCIDKEEKGYVEATRTQNYDVIVTGWIKGGVAKRQIKADFFIRSLNNIQLISWSDNYIPIKKEKKKTDDSQEWAD